MLYIVCSHPIQYQAPIWRMLAERGKVDFEVLYISNHGSVVSHDREFGRELRWDVDLLSGYRFRFPDEGPQPLPMDAWRLALPRSFRHRIAGPDCHALLIPGWNLIAYWQAISYVERSRTQVLLRPEATDLANRNPIKSALRRIALRWFLRRVNWFLCIGSSARRHLLSLGVREEQCLLTPYCVDNDFFMSGSKGARVGREGLRSSYGIADHTTVFAFVGKLIPKKRPRLCLDAALRAVDMDPELRLHLLFVGDGELRAELQVLAENAATRSGHRIQATFLGFVNQREIVNAYVAADFLVLPSGSGETWGLVVNESMASGTPALVSRECGCAEDLVASVDPKAVFDATDPEELAALMVMAIRGQIDTSRITVAIDGHAVRHTVQVIESLAELKR